MRFDVLIQGGEVIDGAGGPRTRADVGVAGDQIAAVGNLSGATAETTIEAGGKIVAPGFIDVHNHADGWLLRRPHLAAKTLQGFTTEVIMSDGISYAPVDEHTWRQWFYYLRSLDALRMDEYRGWKSLAEYQAVLDRHNVQNNVLQVPYGNLRTLVCGFGPQPVDDLQRKVILAEVRRGMETGAAGLSTGLDYLGQLHATTDELVAACSVLPEYDGLYVTHIRYKSGLLPALKEAVEICRRSGARLHVSHLKPFGKAAIEPLLEYLETARTQVDLSFDCYPYLPGSTMLNSLLPYEAWDDGPFGVTARLADPVIRSRFRRALENYRLPLDKLHIAWVPSKENSRHQGKLLSDFAAEMGLPFEEALINLLIDEGLAVLLVFHEGDDEWCWPMLQHDLCMIGTDGIYFDEAAVHPRVYGSSARILGPLVRDRKLFSLEAAVRKLSGYPAERFRIPKRGFVRERHFADLVVFDPSTIHDRAQIFDSQHHSVGVEHVLVNGRPIIRNSAPVELAGDDLPGRSLRCGEG
jgi:N-acyl-D-amino-acid deacylase